jgi:plastocyanin
MNPMHKKWAGLGLITILAAIAFAGCGTSQAPATGTGGSDTTGQAGAQEITITAKDDVFEPKSYTAEAGKPLKITVTNAGQNVHEVEVEGLVPETKLAAGQSKTVDLPAQPAGTYRIYCEIHEDQGMEGDLVVK